MWAQGLQKGEEAEQGFPTKTSSKPGLSSCVTVTLKGTWDGGFLCSSPNISLPCERARKAQSQSGICTSAESGERQSLIGVSGSRVL